MMMKLDSISPALLLEPLRAQCDAFIKALHARSPDMVRIYEDIQSWYSENLKPLEVSEGNGEMSQFLTQYLEQVESILHFISSCRAGDFELGCIGEPRQIFFAHDLLNYARLMPVHLAQMNALEKDDPVTWQALKSGDFVVAISKVPFTALFTDQALEQEIKDFKRHGGIVGLSQDDTAFDRLVTTALRLINMVKQFLSDFPRFSQSSMRCEHYQLYGNMTVRIVTNTLKLLRSIEKHRASNPYADKIPLKNLGSSALVQENAKRDILHYAQKGEKQFQEFVQERLLNTSKVSVWDSLRKMKLKSFSKLMEKTKVLVSQ